MMRSEKLLLVTCLLIIPFFSELHAQLPPVFDQVAAEKAQPVATTIRYRKLKTPLIILNMPPGY